MMIIGINGFKGKMGSLVYEDLKESFLVYGYDKENPLTIEKLIERPHDVVIDFTERHECLRSALLCLTNGIHFISGTTGLLPFEISLIDRTAKDNHLSAYLVYNFSLSFWRLVKCLEILKPGANITIKERHHKSKKDIPSGTAILLKNLLGNEKIKIISSRGDDFVYRHDIIFDNENDSLTMIHEIKDKHAYVEGVKKALQNIGLFEGLRTTLDE